MKGSKARLGKTKTLFMLFNLHVLIEHDHGKDLFLRFGRQHPRNGH
jgi:hypothetical protein